MAPTLVDSRRWVREGTSLMDSALASLDEDSYSIVVLPGWTRRNLVGHVSANAVALGNLVHWASTGEPTPMYSSMDQRNADIEAAGLLSADELTASFLRTAADLESAMDALSDSQWEVEVTTAQGRTVPASAIPWLRAREVMIHAIDLGTGVTFDDLPADFLSDLCDDIVVKRNAGAGPAVTLTARDVNAEWSLTADAEPTAVAGTLAAVAAYLSGRDPSGVQTLDGSAVPELPAWL